VGEEAVAADLEQNNRAESARFPSAVPGDALFVYTAA